VLSNTGAFGLTGANSRTITLTGTNTDDNTLSHSIADPSPNATSVAKSGGGTWVLTNGSTYSGGTTISAGTLKANNATGSATGTGAVTVNNGGTLAGTGAVGGSVTINGGGTLAPGNSIETLDTGALTFNSGSTFAAELNTNVALSVAADLVNANGNLSIVAGAILSLVDAGNTILAPGDKLTLISYAGTWNNGIFLGHPDDSLVTVGVNTYHINYNDTLPGANFGGGAHGNYLTLTAVPETTAFLFAGIACLIAGAAQAIRQVRRRRAPA
jgi:autotransporter-associated beta strand protein